MILTYHLEELQKVEKIFILLILRVKEILNLYAFPALSTS